MELAENMRAYSVEEVKELIKADAGLFKAVYLHWTAGRYGQIYDDYNISIDYDGKIYLPSEDLTAYRSHTWCRNGRGCVGIALCGAYRAVANDGYNCTLGDNPPTDKQIEVMSVLVALFMKYGLVPIENIMTHCEAAFEDNYGPYSGDPQTRWDLWYVWDNSLNRMAAGGDTIRGKALWYLQNYNL